MRKLFSLQLALALIVAYRPFPQSIAGGTGKGGGVSVMGGGPPSGGDTIAPDGASVGPGNNVNQSTLTWNHTVTSNADGILCVGVAMIANSAPPTVLSVTWNTTGNLSFINSSPTGTGYTASSNRVEQWCMLAPATGTHAILVTLTAQVNIDLLAGATSLTGVHQSLTVDATNQTSAASGQPNGTIMTITANAWVLDALADNNADTLSATAPSVARWAFADDARATAGSTSGPKVSPGSVTMAWTGATGAWNQSMIAVRPGP